MDFTNRNPRRTFLQLVGSATVIGLAGCTSDQGTDGGSDDTETASTGTESEGTETTAGNTQRETSTQSTSTEPHGTDTIGTRTEEPTANGTPALSGPVPAVYRTATSLGGSERNPDSLAPKSAVQYQSHPKNGQQCSGCVFYIPDKNGDGLGACSIVEGYIQPEGWCISYNPYQNG